MQLSRRMRRFAKETACLSEDWCTHLTGILALCYIVSNAWPVSRYRRNARRFWTMLSTHVLVVLLFHKYNLLLFFFQTHGTLRPIIVSKTHGDFRAIVLNAWCCSCYYCLNAWCCSCYCPKHIWWFSCYYCLDAWRLLTAVVLCICIIMKLS